MKMKPMIKRELSAANVFELRNRIARAPLSVRAQYRLAAKISEGKWSFKELERMIDRAIERADESVADVILESYASSRDAAQERIARERAAEIERLRAPGPQGERRPEAEKLLKELEQSSPAMKRRSESGLIADMLAIGVTDLRTQQQLDAFRKYADKEHFTALLADPRFDAKGIWAADHPPIDRFLELAGVPMSRNAFDAMPKEAQSALMQDEGFAAEYKYLRPSLIVRSDSLDRMMELEQQWATELGHGQGVGFGARRLAELEEIVGPDAETFDVT